MGGVRFSIAQNCAAPYFLGAAIGHTRACGGPELKLSMGTGFIMDDVELGTILGAHEARITALETGHADHEETLDEHEEVDVHLQQGVDSAVNIALSADDGVSQRVDEGVREAVLTAVDVAAVVAADVAEQVAEDVAEETADDESDVVEIVEGEPPAVEHEKTPAPKDKPPRPRSRPFGRH